VTRTNIFLGRIDQGLAAERLGDHVALETQRALRRLRREDFVQTELIVASVREWNTLIHLAGCDVFTAPCAVLRALLEQREVGAEAIASQLGASYEDRLGIGAEALAALGPQGAARLYRIEPELIQFLRELREHPEDTAWHDGDALYKRFDAAGMGDLFHAPTADERGELRQSKLPRLDGELIGRVALDTHFSLLANADFAIAQEQIDAAIAERVGE
jgi:hypothetical protein